MDGSGLPFMLPPLFKNNVINNSVKSCFVDGKASQQQNGDMLFSLIKVKPVI